METPHVLVIPYPAQGHVIPLLELSQRLAEHWFRITFVNTEHNHGLIIRSMNPNSHVKDRINFVSVPDGLNSSQDRNVPGKLSEVVLKVLPSKVEELVDRMNRAESDKITCVIADQSLGWALEIAEKRGLRRAAFCPAAAVLLVLAFSVPKLIEEGIIGEDGTIIRENHAFQLSPETPAMNTDDFLWARIGNKTMQKHIFQLMLQNTESIKLAEWVVCNSAYELEPGAFSFSPQLLPVGPLLATTRTGSPESEGSFWCKDLTCLEWLDRQAPGSVIYVAFGSFAVIDSVQFQELSLGLELTRRPFLWVVRPEITGDGVDKYPEGFTHRVADRGKMVGWAPQQKILAHPSVACFLSHCGWNSTIEALTNGVPLLCWPYFADQFLNQSYICGLWRAGLALRRRQDGIISREEIAGKVEELLELEHGGDGGGFRDLQKAMVKSVEEGGGSHCNFIKLVNWIKET